MNQYQVGKRAGNGTTSTVYEAKDENRDEVLALKVVKKILVNKGLEKGAMPREMQALQRIAHPNIVELREVIDDETSA
jgi:serine/threonine protein kinase